MYSATYAWAKVIGFLEARFGPLVTSTWLDDAEVMELKEDKLYLYSPSDFRQELIRRNCRQHIEEALRELFRRDMELVICGEAEMRRYQNRENRSALWTYNPHYNFENYIAGTSNTVPLKAAMQVAQDPGNTLFNPLYLYGAPGVGKTHLLYAVANALSADHPEKSLVYVKGEQFTTEMVQSILSGSTMDFRKKYREADVLLVDDIQFIAGKDATQEEFFHTFNDLYEHGKQIVIASDRKPSDMPTLEDRLRGRFGVGVMFEIVLPDADTRMLIIRDKAQKLGLNLDEAAIRCICQNLQGDVRQIEGGLRKIRAYRELSGMPLTRETIERTIEDVRIAEISETVTPELIVHYVCRYYGIREKQMMSQLRSKNISEPRQVAMYLMRQMTGLSLSDVGEFFGRDHGTVHHSVKKVEQALCSQDKRMEGILKDIRQSMESSV